MATVSMTSCMAVPTKNIAVHNNDKAYRGLLI